MTQWPHFRPQQTPQHQSHPQPWAYELAYGESGTPYLGRMVVFLNDDLPALRERLVPTR